MEKGSNEVGGSMMKRSVSDEQLEKMVQKISYKDHPLPDNFEEELHEKFLSISESPQSSGYFPIPVSVFVLALVFAAGFLFGNFFKEIPHSNESDSYHSVIADAEVITGETVTVKLVYEADTNIKNVNFRIALPEGLAFYSKNTEISSARYIEWSGELEKGRNEIPFVVKAKTPGKWLINASAVYESGTLTHEITVLANPEITENGETENA